MGGQHNSTAVHFTQLTTILPTGILLPPKAGFGISKTERKPLSRFRMVFIA
jgi:hypothetical protein